MIKPFNNNKSLLGVIGGMGTQATASFYEKIHDLQNVDVEQDYLDIFLYSMPSIPDRTAFITGQSTESPFEALLHAAKTLESAGASCIALPCATSHFFFTDLSQAVNIPILNMLDETARFVAERGLKQVCLLATDGTIKGRAFHTALEENGIEVIVPSDNVQSDLMGLIYDIKRGIDVSPARLTSIIERSLKEGADAVILGCTELCVIAKDSPDVINILDVLAKASLDKCSNYKQRG